MPEVTVTTFRSHLTPTVALNNAYGLSYLGHRRLASLAEMYRYTRMLP